MPSQLLTPEARTRHMKQERRRRMTLRRYNICVACGHRTAQEDRDQCTICLAGSISRVRRLRADRRANGECLTCGTKLPDSRFVNCEPCRAKNAAASRRHWRNSRIDWLPGPIID